MKDDTLDSSEAHFFSRDDLDDFIASRWFASSYLLSYIQLTAPWIQHLQ